MNLPFFQFYPSDHIRDTRALTLPAKGAWFEILCQLHSAEQRGRLSLTIEAWARLIGASPDETEKVIAELEELRIADISRDASNAKVTIACRRMLRELITREQTRLRVQKYRANQAEASSALSGNTDVTRKKSETRIQKPESRTIPPVGGGTFELLPPPPADEGPHLLVFPCVGAPAIWPLTEHFVAELRRLYPTINPLAQCELAKSKIERKAVSPKTARGMPKFLFAWMDRASDRPARFPLSAMPRESQFAGKF
jgi:uncharacterized protein YdaU (DUF1376 family)